MDEVIIDRLDDHEKRIKALEDAAIAKPKKMPNQTQDYKGLTGAIRLLIDKGFLGEQKSAGEVCDELKKEGYYHSKASVATTLRETFVKRQRVLGRVNVNGTWKYAVRK